MAQPEFSGSYTSKGTESTERKHTPASRHCRTYTVNAFTALERRQFRGQPRRRRARADTTNSRHCNADAWWSTDAPSDRRTVTKVLTVSASHSHNDQHHRLFPENGPGSVDSIVIVDDASRTTNNGSHSGFAATKDACTWLWARDIIPRNQRTPFRSLELSRIVLGRVWKIVVPHDAHNGPTQRARLPRNYHYCLAHFVGTCGAGSHDVARHNRVNGE